MKVFGRMTAFPIMPARISRLYELAYNLWWSWHPEARALYRTLDSVLWDHVGHNPVRFLSEVEPKRLEEAAQRTEYLKEYDSVLRDFDHYMNPGPEAILSTVTTCGFKGLKLQGQQTREGSLVAACRFD